MASETVLSITPASIAKAKNKLAYEVWNWLGDHGVWFMSDDPDSNLFTGNNFNMFFSRDIFERMYHVPAPNPVSEPFVFIWAYRLTNKASKSGSRLHNPMEYLIPKQCMDKEKREDGLCVCDIDLMAMLKETDYVPEVWKTMREKDFIAEYPMCVDWLPSV